MNLITVFNKVKFLPFHIIFWVLVSLFYTYYFGFNSNNEYYVFWFSNILIPITIINTYFTIYYLIPNYLITKKYCLFILYSIYTLIGSAYIITIVMFFGYVYLSESDFNKMPPLSRSLPFILISMYLVVTIVAAFKIVIQNSKTTAKNKELQNKILETQLQIKDQELLYLKKQIHPHFLFNTLNTIYGFALKQSKDTPDIILKLSNLLDYILYQVNKPKVSLREEILHIKEYIELEKIRFQDTLKISFVSDEIPENMEISPMLLIPFVENAFKHGNLIDGFLSVNISIKLKDDSIQFSIKNTVLPDNTISNRAGIGLENIQKRLQLLYPKSHQLTCTSRDNWYVVNLSISNLTP